MSLVAELSQLQATAADRYKQLVRATASGEPSDPAEAQRTITAAGHTIELFEGHVTHARYVAALEQEAASIGALSQQLTEIRHTYNQHRDVLQRKLQQAQDEFNAATLDLQFEGMRIQNQLELAKQSAEQLSALRQGRTSTYDPAGATNHMT